MCDAMRDCADLVRELAAVCEEAVAAPGQREFECERRRVGQLRDGRLCVGCDRKVDGWNGREGWKGLEYLPMPGECGVRQW